MVFLDPIAFTRRARALVTYLCIDLAAGNAVRMEGDPKTPKKKLETRKAYKITYAVEGSRENCSKCPKFI
jgi:hypothetical protein